jgi:hypothetical protein
VPEPSESGDALICISRGVIGASPGAGRMVMLAPVPCTGAVPVADPLVVIIHDHHKVAEAERRLAPSMSALATSWGELVVGGVIQTVGDDRGGVR